jgi:hydroxymethylbilane synthase
VVPQVGQGALAVEARAGVGDLHLQELLGRLEHAPSRRAVDAERAFLAELGGDCNLPAGAHAEVDGVAIRMVAVLASLDGHVVLRHEAAGVEPAAVGRQVARHLRDDAGGATLMAG